MSSGTSGLTRPLSSEASAQFRLTRDVPIKYFDTALVISGSYKSPARFQSITLFPAGARAKDFSI